jgi:hypothetical protein
MKFLNNHSSENKGLYDNLIMTMINTKYDLAIQYWYYYKQTLHILPKRLLSNPITCRIRNRSMIPYFNGEVKYTGKSLIVPNNVVGSSSSPDQILSLKAEQICKAEGINYKDLEPIQRLFLTHYRCPVCKLLPLYCLNLASSKRVRCGRCGNLISFTNSGKYGRLRKKIAFELYPIVSDRKTVTVV